MLSVATAEVVSRFVSCDMRTVLVMDQMGKA